MNKSIILVLAAALSFAVNAREIQIDLGNFPARNCIQFNNPSESPVGSPRYSTRSSRVTGTVLLETINQRDESIVMRCAEQAKAELMESFSPSNTEQFGMVF